MGIAILYPVFAQLALTFILFAALAASRAKAFRSGDVRLEDIALDSSRYPDYARKYANCYANQFEMPVLFYVLCLMTLMTRQGDLLMVVLAWAFVLARVVHALIHTGSNILPRRGPVFLVGVVILAIMTAVLFLRLTIGG